ncbi:DotI/IcmL/TraM family protein [Dryocola clanedunensis]|uniref:DotI/IcmL/TraM family protein n=1 Tax=Cedecea sulfonylureivorans TaxID=3051154 RepID=UPI001926AEFA|nr:DotI/IcmL/TraM family protein [Cedecea sulfonylureivorans]
MTDTTSPEPQAVDARPYAPAVARHIEGQLGVGITRGSVTANVWLSAGLFLSLCINSALVWQVMHPPIQNFATEDGRIIPVVASDIPLYTDAQVAEFGSRVISQAFTLDFVHYREQMNALQGKFSDNGYRSYYSAVTNSNVLASVRDKKMNMSAMTSAGVVVSKGTMGDNFAWKIQYPVVIRLSGQSTSLPEQRFIVSLLITRVDQRKKHAGLEVSQLVTFEAPTK